VWLSSQTSVRSDRFICNAKRHHIQHCHKRAHTHTHRERCRDRPRPGRKPVLPFTPTHPHTHILSFDLTLHDTHTQRKSNGIPLAMAIVPVSCSALPVTSSRRNDAFVLNASKMAATAMPRPQCARPKCVKRDGGSSSPPTACNPTPTRPSVWEKGGGGGGGGSFVCINRIDIHSLLSLCPRVHLIWCVCDCVYVCDKQKSAHLQYGGLLGLFRLEDML
jgi:hypothetical protein